MSSGVELLSLSRRLYKHLNVFLELPLFVLTPVSVPTVLECHSSVSVVTEDVSGTSSSQTDQ